MLLFDATYRDDYPWGEISIPYKLGFLEISPPQSPLPSYLIILNLINPFIIVPYYACLLCNLLCVANK